MVKYFFTGGQISSCDLLFHFQENLRLERQWVASGSHYERTSNAWLTNKEAIMPFLRETDGAVQVTK